MKSGEFYPFHVDMPDRMKEIKTYFGKKESRTYLNKVIVITSADLSDTVVQKLLTVLNEERVNMEEISWKSSQKLSFHKLEIFPARRGMAGGISEI